MRAELTSKKILIAACLKKDNNVRTDVEILDLVFTKILQTLLEKNLKTLRIAESAYIDDIAWGNFNDKLRIISEDLPNTKFILCKGLVRVPAEEEKLGNISSTHESPINGHKGVTKTYCRIKQDFYWPSLKKDIQLFISRCKICQTRKLVRRKINQPMVITDTPGSSFEKVSMYIVELPRSSTQNKYILTMQCLLTKYVLAVPLQHGTSIKIATAILNNLIYQFGAPKIILTDQGSNFMSVLIKNISKICKINQCCTTAYRL